MCSVHSEECIVKALCSSIFFFFQFQAQFISNFNPYPWFQVSLLPLKTKLHEILDEFSPMTRDNPSKPYYVISSFPWSSMVFMKACLQIFQFWYYRNVICHLSDGDRKATLCHQSTTRLHYLASNGALQANIGNPSS